MIQIFDLKHNKLHGLTEYKDLKIEKTLEGDEVLSFLFPQNNAKCNDLLEECYIRTKENEYVIKEKNVDDDWTEFICKLNLEDLKGNIIPKFETTEQTINSALNLALVGTGWTIGSCDVTKKRTITKANSSTWDIIKEAKNIYRCDYKFNAIEKKIYIYKSLGSDKGVYFSEQLNLKKLGVQSNSYDYCTRIIPIGKDGLSIKTINNGKEYLENYQYSNKVITIVWEDNRYTVVEALKEDAQLRLEELSKPIKAYSANVIDLAKINNNYKDILDYQLGDTITLISKDKKIKEKQRIVKIIEYPEEPEKNTCEIANRILKLDDLQREFLEATDIVNTVTTSDGMIDGNKLDSIDYAKIKNVSIDTAQIQDAAITTAKIGTAQITSAKMAEASIDNAHIVNGAIDTAKISDAAITNAKIDRLSADRMIINTGDIQDLAVGTMQVKDAAITNAKIDRLSADKLVVETADIKDAAITNAKISDLNASKIKAGDIDTDRIKTNIITAINANIGTAKIDIAKIDDLNATKITAGDIDVARIKANVITAINTYSGTATIDSAKIGELNASKITTGDLSADRIKSNVITAINASLGKIDASRLNVDDIVVKNLDASVITAGDIDAERIKSNVISAINTYVGTAKIKQAQIETLSIGDTNITDATISGAKITNGSITNAQIKDATIESAKIKSINADIIDAGTLNASKVSINSTDGKLTIANNTITIKDNQVTPNIRVQIGLNSKGTYGIYVLNANGEAIFDSDIGVLSDKGLASNVVTKDKIKNGEIDSSKLNIDELFVGDNAFINSLKAVNIDASSITTGTISNDRINIKGLVSYEALNTDLKQVFSTNAGKTYINGGMIATGSIKANQLDLLSGITVKGLDNTNTFAIADTGEIEINGLLKSGNFDELKSTGYRLSTDGKAILNEATIRGNIILPNAGMTNDGNAPNVVRIWAGASYENNNTAPFRVMQNGDVYATNATLSGILYGRVDSGLVNIDNESFSIVDDTVMPNIVYVEMGRDQTIINTNFILGDISDKRLEFLNDSRELRLNGTDFKVVGKDTALIYDTSDYSTSNDYTGGLNFTSIIGGQHTIGESLHPTYANSLIFDSKGNSNAIGDFLFTRKNFTEKVRVMVDGDLIVQNKVSSAVHIIEMRSVKDEGWGFYAV